MALVTKREKVTDVKYKSAIGTRPPTTDREFELEDVIEDLRDDVNSVIDLANKVDDFTFGFVPARGKVKAKLVITHTKTSTTFTISA